MALIFRLPSNSPFPHHTAFGLQIKAPFSMVPDLTPPWLLHAAHKKSFEFSVLDLGDDHRDTNLVRLAEVCFAHVF